VIIRQSDLKLWAKCPLKYRYSHIDQIPREQSGSLTFGSIVHDCVLFLEKHGNIQAAVERFREFWIDPTALDPTYRIEYYVKGTSWKKYLEQGEKILRDWWGIIQWESDTVLGREFTFDVPIGDGHTLHGTIDVLKVRYRAAIGSNVLLVSDYKTNTKRPTYDWLADDLQFTAYSYATTRPEFWAGMPRGAELYEQFKDYPRYGEWVHLKGPLRLDAGPRDQVQYNRLVYACNALADSVAMRIFVPNISGEQCRYCEFRKQCGLPEIPE